ncbi:Gfo/Idh/MocA family oxidoreductase [Jannaschia sp. Os4]|nr:Gfo/Idh/MocA family oxidoreductase [Jannaschia sp. Os4]MBM2577830.1 Gfo/Idh/MocA family oxidoreductase [Jannaschia sp. Os4]
MAGHLVDAGAALVAWATEGEPNTLPGWVERFPGTPRRDADAILRDASLDLVLLAGVPSERAAMAVRAMEAGHDVLSDKPGALTGAELDRVRATAERTGRIWSVDFSERFETPGSTLAARLVVEGRIGEVLHLTSLGPHRLNAATRPGWFWDRRRNGGILADIGSHQIEQALFYAGADTAEILHAETACLTRPGFEDYGLVSLRAGGMRAVIRVDWHTPGGLPTWGDGRLFLTGTAGTLELRKYVDPGGRPGGDHVILVDGETVARLDGADEPLPFFAALVHDVRHRTETAHPRARPYEVTRLALAAQEMAT